MYLTNGPSGGEQANGQNGQPYANGRSLSGGANQYGGGQSYLGNGGGRGGNNGCFNCGKPGHFARDCWSARRERGFAPQQGDPKLDEMKEHFRQIMRERLEIEEKRRLEEERKAKEEEEVRRNQDFARKAEEFKLQLRAELMEEWRRTKDEATTAMEKTKKPGKIKTPTRGAKGKRKGKQQKRRRKKERETTDEDTEEANDTDEVSTDSTNSESDSEPRQARRKARRERQKKRPRSKRSSTKGKGRTGDTPTKVYERGECSRQRKTGQSDGSMQDAAEEADEPMTPLTGGFKGLSAGCSQRGLIDYCISAHKIYSAKKADTLKKICEKKGIKYTKKPEVVEMLARQQVQLAYEGFEDELETWRSNGKTKASGSPPEVFTKDRTTSISRKERNPVRVGRGGVEGRGEDGRGNSVRETTLVHKGVAYASIGDWLAKNSDQRDTKVEFSSGQVWMEGWRRLRRRFGDSNIEVCGERTLLRHAKAKLQQGGEVILKRIVRAKTTTERNRAMLTALLRRPRPDTQMIKLPTKKLIGLYRTSEFFSEKRTKHRLRTKLDRIIAQKTGVSVRKQVNIKLFFDSWIHKVGVRETTENLVTDLVKDKPLADFVKIRIRVLWLRNKNVGELIHNQKRYASVDEHPCPCGGRALPKMDGHILIRFSDLEVPDFVQNSKNVTRPVKAGEIQTIAKAIFEAVRHLKCEKLPHVEPSVVLTELSVGTADWTNEDVRTWRRHFDGLVLTPIDRNQGNTAVICPVLYRHGFGKTFSWNANYEFVGTLDTEETILRGSRVDYQRSGITQIGNWRPDGHLGTAYVIPKHKDITRWRPIAPASADPVGLGQRRIARALHTCLKRLPTNCTFYMNSIAELLEKLEAMTQRFKAAGCEITVGRCYDIKEMFTRIPHGAVEQVIHQLLRIYEDKGCKQIRVSRRGKLCIIGNNKGKMDGYVGMSLKLVMEGARYDLRHAVVRCGDKLVKQVFGIPMGKSTSPILASITFAMGELRFIQELGSDRRLIGGWRVIDDITIIAGIPGNTNNGDYPNNLFDAFEENYDRNLEIIRKDECGITWHFVGRTMMICNEPLHIHYIPSTKNTESLHETGKLIFQTMQDFYSYTAKSVKKAVLTTILKRLWNHTTNKELVIGAIGYAICEADLREYPPEVSLGALAELAKAVPNRALRCLLAAMTCTAGWMKRRRKGKF
ncbi:hypothetical protein CBR_g22837 [Chara braunii]|uniref:CCHC-type domain-containing protein n=1 Tax=Chara braunii TaxID=69332 RepID=A0A388L2U5_CHABU|nr:hypothetical protein CBR_g22837 [Chara braunii]|eukprot:GBG76621.1 hypothetical protein CBR_g22837 [Chara braunii]